MGQNLFELRQIISKIIKDLFSLFGTRQLHMVCKHFLQHGNILLMQNLLQGYQLLVYSGIEISVFIQDIGNATTHACGKVFACIPNNNGNSPCHIFTAMVTNAFNNGSGTGITNAEAFSCNTVNICLTIRCTIQCNIADNDIFILFQFAFSWWIHD
ncbi:hypothetical protein SDC9_209483 [bioreactor metagenome]|uniref:Uncharacterized protein n=1 Tax=bioreactor metagenome TaxID=1076179 RepID=A0A645JDS6_9ZZZZ